jgi:SAM-dependent methyltransferase
LVPYLDLGIQPPSNSFLEIESGFSEQQFPLIVNLCTNCGFSQLSICISSEQTFGDYAYRTSSSSALQQSFSDLSESVLKDHVAGRKADSKALVVDIGCNDGYLLKQFDSAEFKLLGIEPSNAAFDAIGMGFEVENVFFGDVTSKYLTAKHGKANIILCTNVLAHVPNIKDFLLGIKELMAQDGTFLLEFPYVLDMIENKWFDTIYHEHLSYISITPLRMLLNELGMEIQDISRHPVGGSGPHLRLKIKHISHALEPSESVEMFLSTEKHFQLNNPESYKDFSKGVEKIKDDTLKVINEFIGKGLKIGAYGAPAKGNTFLNYLGLTSNEILAVADATPIKIGRLTPGSRIPIVGDQEFIEMGFAGALLLSWNYLEYFLKSSEFYLSGRFFIVPFPDVRIIELEKG